MNNQDYRIALNFLALREQEFCFTVYRRAGDFQPNPSEKSLFYKLPISEAARAEEWLKYSIRFSARVGFEPFECSSKDNAYLTLRFLYENIKNRCITSLSEDFEFKDKFENKISIFMKRYAEGAETIDLIPYRLKIFDKIGILINFRFTCHEEFKGTKIAQQLSLSLDRSCRSNKNFYLDKFEKIKIFTRESAIFDKIFPFIDSKGKSIDISKSLERLPSHVLQPRTYVFGGQKNSKNKFQGLKQLGPLAALKAQPTFYFAFPDSSREYGLDLYRALKGSFESAFPGMEIFGISLEKENTNRSSVSDFSSSSVTRMIDQIKKSGSKLPIQIAIIKSKLDDSYFELKHQFLDCKIPLQMVTLDLLKSKSNFQWSASNIGLQIFSKLGGQPWKVHSENPSCLIIGIGQSHTFRQEADKKVLKKFFSYSVLLDSTGLYQDIKVLGASENQSNYMQQVRRSIQVIVENYSQRFNQIVIHTPFKLKKKDLDNITETLKELSGKEEYCKIDFSVIKINIKNKFFGYYTNSNGLVPYESSCLELSNKEYLLWLEGINQSDTTIRKRYSGPVHIEFHYSNTRLSSQQKMLLIQDIINLSGANWRGFNALSLPISIYYCKLISDLLSALKEKGYQDTEIEDSKPWFL